MVLCHWLLFFSLLQLGGVNNLYAEKLDDLHHLIGDQDAIVVADPRGRIIFAKNMDSRLIPASTLKILTSLVALHYLGPEHRFVTEFYRDQDSNLKIKGYGDPVLISEIFTGLVNDLATQTNIGFSKINDVVLDDSYFQSPIIIPGINSSYEPYDAPNGALCVNFNTVNFKRNSNGNFISAEPQTPLLPFVMKRIKTSKMDQGRIILSHKKNEMTRYAGHLLIHFMNKEGIKPEGNIRIDRVQKKTDQLFFKYVSKFSLEQVISKLLEHSNNFVANQLLIAVGAKTYGPPGTLEKGVRTALDYTKRILKMDGIRLVEGSGISRKNRISAINLYKILQLFEPYHYLMKKKEHAFYKTGTLYGVNTLAGYIETNKKELYGFVVLINTPGKSSGPILDILLRNLH
jgi:D-alanyl-D-alanine carboxypeptidase/D-alanyl-D-alanine-endopeptidase (penicillin-binding protein 4)